MRVLKDLWNRIFSRNQKTESGKKKGKKVIKKNGKIEFIKYTVLGSFILAFLAVIDSYVLAHLGMDTNSEVTSEVVRSLLGVVTVYGIKSFGEKNSRNKYNVAVENEELLTEDDEVTEEAELPEDVQDNIDKIFGALEDLDDV